MLSYCETNFTFTPWRFYIHLKQKEAFKLKIDTNQTKRQEQSGRSPLQGNAMGENETPAVNLYA